MGKFIHEPPPWQNETEMRLRELLSLYNEDIFKFETQKNKRAGVRARAYLLELYHLCRTRRKEILEDKRQMTYEIHPSWEAYERGEGV
jgi:hypothetical protein